MYRFEIRMYDHRLLMVEIANTGGDCLELAMKSYLIQLKPYDDDDMPILYAF
jgi:hypothetical protein